MDLCKLCRYEKDALGLECELRLLVQTQALAQGVEVTISACNGFAAHDAFAETEDE